MGTGLILLAGILFSKDQKFARPSKSWFYLAQVKNALLEEINCVQCPLYNQQMITTGQVEHCIETYQASGQVMQTTTGPFFAKIFLSKTKQRQWGEWVPENCQNNFQGLYGLI